MASAPWRIVHASVIGSSHIKAGAPCQDYSLHELVDCAESESVLVTVISDGAGSAEQAAAASSTACHAFISLVRSFINDGGLVSSLDRTQAQVWIKDIANQLE